MDSDAGHKKGLELAKNGSFDAAIVLFSKVIVQNPDSARAYYNRGLAHIRNGAIDKAITDFSESIRLMPTLACAYNNRGMAKIEKGNYEQAVADFDEAIRLNSHYGLAYSNRGLALQISGNHEMAIADLEKANFLFSQKNLDQHDRKISMSVRARRVMEYARDEANLHNSECLETEHVLLGILKEGSGVTPSMMRRIDHDFAKVRQELNDQLQNSNPRAEGIAPCNPAVVRVLEIAEAEARTLGHNFVQAKHILLGLLQSPNEIACSVLLHFGVEQEAVRMEIDEWD